MGAAISNSNPAETFPLTVVAVGASAGGLDALRQLFGAATPHPSIAFVVITHLPASHDSHLPELLAKAGPLPAAQAEAGNRLEGGRIYVMPPSKLMGLSKGVIRFEDGSLASSPPKPIDFFMTSLSEDMAGRAVGVVLSGTDHDGTVGLKAIKAVGGLTLAQSPDTAEFPGMPRSAIESGVADFVLPPDAMPAALLDFLDLEQAEPDVDVLSTEPDAPGDTNDLLQDILSIVMARSSNDFRAYRPGMLRRRLRRRMVLVHRHRLDAYLELLSESPDEAAMLSREFLIGVTDFFRDATPWDELATHVLPALLATRNVEQRPIRIWTPGCSSGEETYSIAMLLQELLGHRYQPGTLQVFGTDIDVEALATARRGDYPESIVSTVSVDRLARFFERRGGRYTVRKGLRDAVTFAPQNLIRDTPFSRLDLVVCRNVLMYFEPALQERVLQLFHFSLVPGGLLWLGKAESLGAHSALFEPVSTTMRLFRRVGARSHMPRGFASLSNGSVMPEWRRRAGDHPQQVAEIVRAHLAGRQVSAAVLTDRGGRALHFHGDTARFLAPQGDASLDLLRLVRSDLRSATRAVLREAVSQVGASERRTMLGAGPDAQQVLLQASVPAGADEPGLVIVLFTAIESAGQTVEAVTTSTPPSQADMDDARRELDFALEDAERSNEELRLAGEEAFALNEELQSSNEELESSKEELQSLNEELATVNSQLEDRIVEAVRNSEDFSNLLASTHIATLLLDSKMRIRRFTPAAAELFSLRRGDEGRLLSDMSRRVVDPHFDDEAREVLAGAPVKEAEIKGSTGSVLLRRLRPFLVENGGIDGVVVTFVDITSIRTAASQARHLLAMLADSNDAVISFDLQGRILAWNAGAEKLYGYRTDEALQTDIFSLTSPSERSRFRTLVDTAIRGGSAGPEQIGRTTNRGEVVQVSLALSSLRDENGTPSSILSTERDITEKLRIASEMRFRRLADDIPALLRVDDRQGMAEFVNRSCAEFTGQPRETLLGRGWQQFVHPDDRAAYIADDVAALARRTGMERDVRMLRHDGIYRWMRIISVPHASPEGEFTGFVALMIDVEDRKLAELELFHASRRKDEFLAMLAHELRNPLSAISNSTAVLAGLAFGDGPGPWAVGIIQRQTRLLSKLLDDLLDLARIAQGKIMLTLAPAELRVVLDQAVEVSRALIDSRHQTLVVEPIGDWWVEAEVTRLVQVFTNLLNNAAKYTQEGGEIRLQAGFERNQVVVRVADNGTGIEPEMLLRVFEMFAQADITLDRAQGGLGLGLTLVQRLVTLHGGTVEAESEGLGQGSVFTVRLPVLDRPKSTSVSDGSLPKPTGAAGRRILVVDDNVESALTLAMVLKTEGHEVFVSVEGHAAIAEAQRVSPDVVILDIGLPGLNGYEVARRLRGMSATSKARLIALTGYGRPDDIAASRAAGFDEHLVKPVDLAVLLPLVASARSQESSG